jgi:dihydroorotase
MENLLFQNVTLTEPGADWHGKKVDVLILGGQIAEIAAASTIVAAAGIRVVQGGHISPAWVDLRTHGTVPGEEHKEDLESLAQAALAGGFAAVLSLPNTHPPIDNAAMVRALLSQGAQLPIHLLVAGAISIGAKGQDLAELYDMHQAGASAFCDGLRPIPNAGTLLRALQYVHPFGGLIMSMPLDLGLAGNAEVGEGIVATQLGMKGIPALAEEMQVVRDLKVLTYYPQRLHIGPLTTAAALAAVQSLPQRPAGLSLETSALYLLLDDSAMLEFDANTKVWPPLRTAHDVAALRAAVIDGSIDIVSSSHHPASVEDKGHDFADAAFGASTLETTFAAALTGLGAEGLDALIAAMAQRPRALLGLPSASIQVGATAEISHFAPDAQWEVRTADIRSRSKHNPLLGRTLTGQVRGVYVRGRYHAR